MRYHKRRGGRKLIDGLWYSTIETYQKVVSMAKEVGRKAIRTDIVATQLEDGKKVKALVVARRFKNKRLQYRLTIGDQQDIWVDAEPWKVIEKVFVPLRSLHNTNWKGVWKREWKLMKTVVMPALNKPVHQRTARRLR